MSSRVLLRSASAFALAAMSQAAMAQAEVAQQEPASSAATTQDNDDVIVVTGSIRSSLEAAAEIKRESVQVVDSIVAEDIGKFPDPTTAAALQRVPGVQVSIGNNNEIVGVLIRGLSDILTTLDGRELFSTTGRTFAFQDLPAEALSRVDVIKSNTADLIEGGIAGITDLQLNKPFNFKDPTIVVSARGNYASNVEKLNPQLSVLATDTWDTGIGEIGALINVSWSKTDFNRPVVYTPIRRATSFRFNLPGFMVQNVAGGVSHYGEYERPQANASLQWQATPELRVYVDGLFAGYRSDHQSIFVETQLTNAGTGLSDYTATDDCFLTRVNGVGLNPNAVELSRGQVSPTNPGGGFTVQTLCNITSATFTNATAFTSSQARTERTDNYLGAFGVRYESDRTKLQAEAAYQDSTFEQEVFIVDIGKRLPVTIVDSDADQGGNYIHPGNPLGFADDFRFRNGLNQNFNKSTGDLFQARIDGSYELDSFVKEIQVGLRYANRGARFDQAQVNRGAPGGDMATLLSSVDLPDNFLVFSPGVPRMTNGAPVLIPNPDYLRSDEGRDNLRGIFGFPAGDPAYMPERRFDATEKTYASYVQAAYEFDLGGPILLDGIVGVRPTRTERTISGAGVVSGVVTPVTASTTDTDILPNASARIQFGGGLQARATYSKTIRRPGFGQLNPGISYIVATNPNVINSGSAGNPDLRPQVSDSYDATLEYYFPSGFVAVGVYYRDIKDRVISAASAETIDGIVYNISRPRNVGAAELKGIEVSGQTFFDFLPGALSGFGVFGNFTYADTTVKGEDRLAGLPLQGVSKYNYNAGLLYERYGLSARLVYTYRSRYYDDDVTGGNALRPIEADRVDDLDYTPVLLGFVRPAGRLDFSVGYDINENIRVDVGGTNILRSQYKSYFGLPYLNRDVRNDDSIYTAGIRARF